MAKPAKETAMVEVSVVGLMRPLMCRSKFDMVIVLTFVMNLVGAFERERRKIAGQQYIPTHILVAYHCVVQRQTVPSSWRGRLRRTYALCHY